MLGNSRGVCSKVSMTMHETQTAETETAVEFVKTPECNAEECPTCGWTSPMRKGPARECVEPEEGLRYEDEHGNVKRVVKVFRCGGDPYKVRVEDEEHGGTRELSRHFLNKCWASRFHRGEWKVAAEDEAEEESTDIIVAEEDDGAEVLPESEGATDAEVREAIEAAEEDEGVEVLTDGGEEVPEDVDEVYRGHTIRTYRVEDVRDGAHPHEIYVDVDGERLTSATELERDGAEWSEDNGWEAQLREHAREHIDAMYAAPEDAPVAYNEHVTVHYRSERSGNVKEATLMVREIDDLREEDTGGEWLLAGPDVDNRDRGLALFTGGAAPSLHRYTETPAGMTREEHPDGSTTYTMSTERSNIQLLGTVTEWEVDP